MVGGKQPAKVLEDHNLDVRRLSDLECLCEVSKIVYECGFFGFSTDRLFKRVDLDGFCGKLMCL